MIVLQKNRGSGTYLEIGDICIPKNYECQMLKVNSFRYIAKSVFREVDNEEIMGVRIDGLTLLSEMYSRLRPSRKELEKLLLDMSLAIKELKDYMLNPEGLILDLRYILYSKKDDHHIFLYIPGRRISFSIQLKNMMDELMKIYNHQDREETEYFYEMYSSFIIDNFTPEYFCGLMARENRKQIIKQEPAPEPITEPKSDAVFEGFSGEQQIEQKEGADISLYALVMIAAIVISLVLFLFFGMASFKVSVLINLAGMAFIVVCELQRKKKDEEEEAMSVFMKESEQVEKMKTVDPVMSAKERVPMRIPSEDEYIETSVLSESTEGVSKLISKGEKLAEDISIPEGRLRIGRMGSVCEYCIDEPAISRVHAVLEKKGSTVTLTDMDSTNGTYVNDRRIQGTETVELNQGDIVSMADIKYECL